MTDKTTPSAICKTKFVMPVKGGATRICRPGETLQGAVLSHAAAHGFCDAPPSAGPQSSPRASVSDETKRAAVSVESVEEDEPEASAPSSAGRSGKR